MNKKLHNKWLKAFETTLEEYQENRHDLSDCALCDVNIGVKCKKNVQ